jgi:hypothetical protein
MNNNHDREYKGALTNVASFDDPDLNIITYIDGQVSGKAPMILQMLENKQNNEKFVHDENKVKVLLENTIRSKYHSSWQK